MSKHLKRLAAPRSWRLARKLHTWTVKPSPGPHPIERSMPLLILVRDILNYCDTYREARRIIGMGEIMIDGRVRKNYKYPVGLMDVITIPKLDINYRVLLDRRNKITLVKMGEYETKEPIWKLARIEDKRNVSGGKFQLNLHDGRNILVTVEDAKNYRTGDVLKIELPEQKILDKLKFEAGNMAYIIGGKHVGEISKIKEYKILRSPQPNVVVLEDEFETIKDYVFVVGRDKPLIQLPEVKVIET